MNAEYNDVAVGVVKALAEQIGIHQLYAIVCDLRGEENIEEMLQKEIDYWKDLCLSYQITTNKLVRALEKRAERDTE